MIPMRQDLDRLGASFADALNEAGFDLDRAPLDAALRAYERWLGVPMPGLVWGESDVGIVVTEPKLDGSYEIDLRRHVGESGGASG
jgi:hypothetical protein